MHIVHLYDTLDPRNGGPPFVIAGLAEGQRRLGHEITLVSTDPAQSDPVDGFLRDHILGPYRRISCPLPQGLPALTRVLRRADGVHLHGLWPPLVNAAARLCRLQRVPYVFAPHGMLSPANFGRKALKKQVAMKALGYRDVIRRAGAVHTLNTREAAAVAEWGLVKPERIHVLPNGVMPETFERLPAPGRFRFFHREVGQDPFVLYLGRLHAQKGLDLLARAFAQVTERHETVRLVVAGPDKGYKSDLEALVAELGITDRVHFIGPTFGTDKLQALVDSALFCLTSREEGFSMAITEALACGKPAVVTETCNFPEVAEADAGRVVALDPPAIAEALLEVLEHTDREAMGARGRDLVLERFTWPAIAARSIKLYESARR
ncbi:MAG: glycosyltransferase [Bradymonadia bacterium]